MYTNINMEDWIRMNFGNIFTIKGGKLTPLGVGWIA